MGQPMYYHTQIHSFFLLEIESKRICFLNPDPYAFSYLSSLSTNL